MGIEVLFFGELAEISGNSSAGLDLARDTDELLEILMVKYPDLRNKSFSVALNNKMIKGPKPLNEGDVLALMPPFSGG
ncbi:MAG TPA: MoaD/ThiS family protein [Bacteroidia bacterium]|nr:MoaD/ThiS family protein [Bacteroidia bacterium]